MTHQALHEREQDGIVVKLWVLTGCMPTVTVKDEKTGENFAIECTPDKALDCFYHPFAYRARAEAAN